MSSRSFFRQSVLGAIVGLMLFISFSFPTVAMSQEQKEIPMQWVRVPEPPRFVIDYKDEASEKESCGEIQRSEKQKTTNCWANRVTENAQASYRKQKSILEGGEFACFSKWEFLKATPQKVRNDSEPNPCIGEKGRCARPLILSGDVPASDLPDPGKLFKVVGELVNDLDHAFTDFQYLRRGAIKNRFNQELSALAVKQGILVLYQGRRLLSVKQEVEKKDCWVNELDELLLGVEKRLEEVRTTGLHPILNTYPKESQKWERKLYELQLAILYPGDKKNWIKHCNLIASKDNSTEMDGYKSDLNAWCGYAFEREDDKKKSTDFMKRAQSGVHHPEVASYANSFLPH